MPPCLCDDLEMFPREYPDDPTNAPLVACYNTQWQAWRDSCAQCGGSPEDVCECRNSLYITYLMGVIVCDMIYGQSESASRRVEFLRARILARDVSRG